MKNDNCPLCDSKVAHDSPGEGVDALFCSNSECPLSQVEFDADEWGKLTKDQPEYSLQLTTNKRD